MTDVSGWPPGTKRIAVLGSGSVGRTLAERLAKNGHGVTIGTRDVDTLIGRRGAGAMGEPPFSEWHLTHADIAVEAYADAASAAELIINATNGAGTLDALAAAGADNLAGKVLIDASNPLDFSGGFPPALLVSNTDSLAERIQRAFPEARVVKTLNTVSATVMVAPGELADGDHHAFMSGDDEAAKVAVREFLQREFGWRGIIDLGDISTARGPEMYLALWTRLAGALEFRPFSIKVVT